VQYAGHSSFALPHQHQLTAFACQREHDPGAEAPRAIHCADASRRRAPASGCSGLHVSMHAEKGNEAQLNHTIEAENQISCQPQGIGNRNPSTCERSGVIPVVGSCSKRSPLLYCILNVCFRGLSLHELAFSHQSLKKQHQCECAAARLYPLHRWKHDGKGGRPLCALFPFCW
jgi:hypothetical protein